MKIAIVGTGAMGSVYAGLLARAGHEVWAIDIWQEHLEAIATDGLTVTGASGQSVVRDISVARRPADAGPCDLWIVATKAADSGWARTTLQKPVASRVSVRPSTVLAAWSCRPST